MRKVSIIGVGRVGGALAIALSRAGFEIENLIVRNRERAEKANDLIQKKTDVVLWENLSEISSEIVLIAAQDFEIEKAAENLAGKIKNARPFVFHTSGSLSSEILNPLKRVGCKIGSIHPLVSLSDPLLGAERFADAYFCVEGDREAVEVAREIVAELGGKSFSIETAYKTLYHASAVTACGHLVALVDAAIEMLAKCGLSENQAQETLLPLIKSTLENLEVQNTAEALTGTFARADIETFEKHLAALDANVSGETRAIYLQLGTRSARLAARRGANAEKISKILKEISLAKKKIKC